MTRNNIIGMKLTGRLGLFNNAKEFSENLLDISTTTIYHENGKISKNTNYIIKDPLLAEMQREYLEMYNFYDKQLSDKYSIFERHRKILEKIGESPLSQVIMNILMNPDKYEENSELRILPEIRPWY